MDFWKHIIVFPSNTRGGKEKVIVIVIESNNGKKNIEIQFDETADASYEYEDEESMSDYQRAP